MAAHYLPNCDRADLVKAMQVCIRWQIDEIIAFHSDEKHLSASTTELNAAVLPLFRISELAYIGAGGFAEIFKGVYEGTPVAVKVMKFGLSAEADKSFKVEVVAARRLQSEYVTRLLGAFCHPEALLLVMDYMPGGNLRELLDKPDSLPWDKRLQYALDIAVGMDFLHKRKVIHCDLKAANILLDDHGRCKIGDFGLSVVKRESTIHSQATGLQALTTLSFMAPELFNNMDAFSFKSDVYAFGVLLWELASRKYPFEGQSNAHQVIPYLVTKKAQRQPIPSGTPEQFEKLLTDCWRQVKSERPEMEEVVARLKAMIPRS